MEASLGCIISLRLALASGENLSQKTKGWRHGSVGKVRGYTSPRMHRPWVPTQLFKKETGLHFICSPLTGVLGSFPGPCCKGSWSCLLPFRHPSETGSLVGRNGSMSIKFHSNHLASGSSTRTPVVQGWAAQLVCDGKGPTFLLEASGAFSTMFFLNSWTVLNPW